MGKETRLINMRKSNITDFENCVYIGRPLKWGNPFKIGRDGSRKEVVKKYKKWILEQKDLLASLDELDGKVLACWCSPEPCHGDVLIELLENRKKIRSDQLCTD